MIIDYFIIIRILKIGDRIIILRAKAKSMLRRVVVSRSHLAKTDDGQNVYRTPLNMTPGF
jgi:hypothetical protein